MNRHRRRTRSAKRVKKRLVAVLKLERQSWRKGSESQHQDWFHAIYLLQIPASNIKDGLGAAVVVEWNAVLEVSDSIWAWGKRKQIRFQHIQIILAGSKQEAELSGKVLAALCFMHMHVDVQNKPWAHCSCVLPGRNPVIWERASFPCMNLFSYCRFCVNAYRKISLLKG